MMLLLLCSLVVPPIEEEPRFAAYQRDTDVPIGRLVRLSPDWAVELADEQPIRIDGRDLVELRRDDRPLPPWPVDAHLRFTNGDRLPGQPIGGDKAFLLFRPLGVGSDQPASEWKIPWTQLSIIWAETPTLKYRRHDDWLDWMTGPRDEDALLLANRDFLPGTFLGITDGEIRFNANGNEITVPWSKVAALGLRQSPRRASRRSSMFGQCVLADGSRLTVASLTGDSGFLTGRTFFRQEVRIPVSELITLRIHNGAAVYLSEQDTIDALSEPFFRTAWPWRRDRSCSGAAIRIRTERGVETFDVGLGTRPETRLTIPLGEPFRRFESWVGLRHGDDPARRIGLASVIVSSSGGATSEPIELTGSEPARWVRVPLDTGKDDVGSLILQVNGGRSGPVQSDVDWGSARLIR